MDNRISSLANNLFAAQMNAAQARMANVAQGGGVGAVGGAGAGAGGLNGQDMQAQFANIVKAAMAQQGGAQGGLGGLSGLANAAGVPGRVERPNVLPVSGLGGMGGVQSTEGFGTALKVALQNVSAAQNESSELQRQVTMGNPNVSLEETMMSMQKAQIGFQAALNVRNRMMQAYTDIMNMQV